MDPQKRMNSYEIWAQGIKLTWIHILACFKTIYASQDNLEILAERSEKLKLEIGNWSQKTGFQTFSLKQNSSFEYEY